MNRLALRVWKWTPGSWFEDQDFYRFSGIFRDVFLYIQPKAAVTDLSVRPLLNEDLSSGTLAVCVKGHGTGTLRLSLLAGESSISEQTVPLAKESETEFHVSAPLLWSAEHPNLYTLIAEGIFSLEFFSEHLSSPPTNNSCTRG